MRATSAASSGRATLTLSASCSMAKASRNVGCVASRKCVMARLALAAAHALDAEPDEHASDRNEWPAEHQCRADHGNGIADILGVHDGIEHRTAAENPCAEAGRYKNK